MPDYELASHTEPVSRTRRRRFPVRPGMTEERAGMTEERTGMTEERTGMTERQDWNSS